MENFYSMLTVLGLSIIYVSIYAIQGKPCRDAKTSTRHSNSAK